MRAFNHQSQEAIFKEHLSRPTADTSSKMSGYIGTINCVFEAFLLAEASLRGYIHMADSRPSAEESERIRAGTTVVFNETACGMTRWIDGRSWSPSRFRDGFFIYQELEPRIKPKVFSFLPQEGRKSDSSSRPKKKPQSRSTVGRIPTGLYKKTISVVAPNGHHIHIISYYTEQDQCNSIRDLLLTLPDSEAIFDQARSYKYFKCFRTQSKSWRTPCSAPGIPNISSKSLPSNAGVIFSQNNIFSEDAFYQTPLQSMETHSAPDPDTMLHALPPISALANFPDLEQASAPLASSTKSLQAEDSRQLSLLSRFLSL